MNLTSFDIKNQDFSRIFRGFDPTEVKDFLEDLAVEWEQSEKRLDELGGKIVELETQLKDFKSMEKALQQTFVQAQETSAKSVDQARREAQLIIQEAEMKASQILDKSRHDLTALKEQVTILKAKKDSMVSRLRILLNSELDLIKALEVDEEGRSDQVADAPEDHSKEKKEIDEIIRSLDR
jgi:cell division initiation protein